MAGVVVDACLIYLPKPYLKEPDAQAPLGLLYLAAVLGNAGFTVTVKNYSTFTDEQAVEDLPLAEVYGITVTSMELLQADRFAGLVKTKYPWVSVVIGGPGTAAFKEIEAHNIDSVCYGEGEPIICDIVNDAIDRQIKPEYQANTVQNIDEIPFPARHLLMYQGGHVFAYGKEYGRGESTIILSSRGCPYSCAFCSAPQLTQGRHVRYRTPVAVAREMAECKERYGITQFRFSDDMFTAPRKRVFEMCEAIGPLDVAWRISCRVKPLDSDMLRAMKDAGCKELSFGVESFDNDVLAGLNKRQTATDIVRALEMLAGLDYSVRILMMIRTPYQTPKTIEVNKEYLSRVPYSILACTAFIPIPGCDIWYHPDKYGIEILDRNFDNYNFYMFGPDGRVPIKPIINIKGRDIDEYHQESEDFRDWLEMTGKVNRG